MKKNKSPEGGVWDAVVINFLTEISATFQEISHWQEEGEALVFDCWTQSSNWDHESCSYERLNFAVDCVKYWILWYDVCGYYGHF